MQTEKNNADRLAPCPFCFSAAKPLYFRGGFWHTGCDDCDIIMAGMDKEEVTFRWNRSAESSHDAE